MRRLRLKESQESDFSRAVQLGEDNAECLRQMRSWCEHVEIERTSEGLYAQMTGLPIASHSVACPKIEGEMESMNLRWVFSDFLVQHCATCPHHTPNGDPSWGQAVIDKHRKEVEQREQVEKEESDRIFKLRSKLRSKSRNINAETEPESHQIIEYLEAFFSEDEAERNNASERLAQSARVGADLFPDAAVNLVLLLAGSNDFSGLTLPICTELAKRRPDLCSPLSRMALDNIEKGLHPELSASVLDALGKDGTYALSEVHVKKLLLSQSHYRLLGVNQRTDYPHSTSVIVQGFDAEPDKIQNIVRRELQSERAAVRFGLCGAIKLIQYQRPQFVENLLEDLVRSLELPEDARLDAEPPSGQIIRILQSAFRYSPKKVDAFLAESMSRVRPAVQEDIARVYRDQFFDRTKTWEDRRERRNRTEVTESERVAIQRLLSWLKDDDIDIDIRARALEALGIACDYSVAGVLSEFDSLFGYFAIVSAMEHPPPPLPKIVLPNQPKSTKLDQLDEFSRAQQWNIFTQRLLDCLKKLCATRSLEIFNTLSNCLSQPWEHLDNGFKGSCVLLLGELGKDYILQPRVLPLVWRALMDYESAWVRANAIAATIEMFSSSSASPPANLVDTIIVHLQDPEVAVHQAALRVVSRRPRWFDERQSIEILNCLARHLNAYQDDKYQLDDICYGILKISRRNERLKLFGLRMIESVLPTGEELVDGNITENLIWFCKPSERIAVFVAKIMGTYLANYARDRYNDYGSSERIRMFEWLHQLPEKTCQDAADDLLTSARELAKRDPWEAPHFASLFARFRMFRYEEIVLETAAKALPEEPRYETFRKSLHQLAMIASENVVLQADDAGIVDASFPGIKDKE